MDSKGQITIDYLISITIFLFTVIFVFNYTSGIFAPFNSNSDEITLIADRTATALVEKILSEGDETVPNLVTMTKADIFFTELGTNYTDTTSYLGLSGSYVSYDFNVTLQNGTGLINMAGKPIPSRVNVGQTKRIVLIKDDTGNTEVAIMSFRVW
ncbi:hypothetical protein [Methanolobus sp. WCC5]|jgi:uncharacterized protein (UPF0333 family)|uniref:DUF7287 family protein n=1 Tax=Methanolobus sp. WCC5 TaxID=3125785 RepID=UPI0032430EA7